MKKVKAATACIVHVVSYFAGVVGSFGLGNITGIIAINMGIQTYTKQFQKAFNQKTILFRI